VTSGTGRVVVVGGGVLGTMHALLAHRSGHEVVHLERDAGPRRASVRNFGLVWVSGRAPGRELEAAQRARDLWEQLAGDIDGIGFRPAGSLTVALDDAELAVLAGSVDLPDAADRQLEVLTPVEARSHNPAVRGDIAGAMLCRRDAVVEPGAVLGAIRAHLSGAGRYRYLGCRTVLGLGTRQVEDHTGEVHGGDLVVLCPGAVHDVVAAEHLRRAPLRRCRLQMCETAPFPMRLPTAVADADSLRYYPAFSSLPLGELAPQSPVAAEHRMQLLLVQRVSGALTIGDTHAYDEPFDFAVEEAPYEHLVARAEAILGRELPPIRRRWAGVYSQRSDGALCHREQLDNGTWLVTGPGGRGMTLAPALAEQTLEDASR
jgi:FAD dependent oxidoreductase TIGR03364